MSRFLSIFSDGRDKPEPLLVSAVDFDVYRSLAARLKDSDMGVRESAAEAIGILGGTEVAVDLVAALGDAVPAVRAAAVTAIVKVGTSADGEALLPLFKDSSTTVRRRAIAGMGRLKVGDAAPGLRRFFDANQDAEDGILALSSLAQIALPQDRALFQRLALQADPRRRRPSIEGLARLNDKANEARFKRDFQREKNEELRAAYAFAIFLFGDRPFIDTVVLGLAGSKDRARQARGYVEELGARALPEVLDYLREPDPKIRAGLCDALSTAGVADAAAAIEPLTKERDELVSASALRAMAILRRPR
jgi:HEAT repeat protein